MSIGALPSIVALWGCPAQNEAGENILASGLFEVIEHWSYDPSAGAHTGGFLIAHVPERVLDLQAEIREAHERGWAPEKQLCELASLEDELWPTLWIDEEKFLEQVRPKRHATVLVQEREMDITSEMLDVLGVSKPYFECPLNVPGEYDKDNENKGHEFLPTGREEGYSTYFGGPTVGIEMRCCFCGAIKWDVA